MARFALDQAGKPQLVLMNGRRRRLPYVPDSAWLEIQRRWLTAIDLDVPSP